MKTLVFSIVLASYALNAASVTLSIVRPDLRIWPPPRRDWKFVWNGVLSYGGLLGLVVLGIVDWNSFALRHWMRFLVGGLLMVAGGSFALWAFATLGPRASQGLGGGLVNTGPYRYSRNPQYVGTIPVLISYAVLCNSALALAAALVASGWFVLVPFAEEPWLRGQLGPAYEEYASRVPRFLPFGRLRS